MGTTEKNHTLSKHNKPKFIKDNGGTSLVQLVREQPPEHCILKLESFSMTKDAVSKSNNFKHEISSSEFKAGGYTWVLSVYLNNNEQKDGGGYVSMYVTLIDKLGPGSFINASLRFFIYDQIHDNYLSFLDVVDKRFNAIKTQWGIQNLLSLESFTDASNGFLVNDSCTFGTEILIRSGETKTSIVSPLKLSRFDNTYSWNFKKFSDAKENYCYSSPVFSTGELSWKLKLYPRGDSNVKGEYVSLFLGLENAKELTHGKKLYARYSLCIKNQDTKRVGCNFFKKDEDNKEDYKKTISAWFNSELKAWGNSTFLSTSELTKTSNGFLVNNTMIVEVTIEAILLLKDIDPIVTDVSNQKVAEIPSSVKKP